MLPILGFAALYFRYRRIDERLRPARWWDMFLVVSCLGLVVAGGWLVTDQLMKRVFG
jgi:hypothetical protein